ncbi:MAG: DUF3656 domain-containing U32 family peptidase, partial [Candidatus Aenigmatarchaeota archaeon]
VRPMHENDEEILLKRTFSGELTNAKDADVMKAAAKSAFEKLGDTPFSLGEFALNNPFRLFVPISRLNQIRRDISGEIEEKIRCRNRERIEGIKTKIRVLPKDTPAKKETQKRWSIKVDDPQCLEMISSGDAKFLDEVIIDISESPLNEILKYAGMLERLIGREKIRLALPAVTRRWERDALKEKINALAFGGWKSWQVSNLSGFEFLPKQAKDLNISSDWPLYVTNHMAAESLFALKAKKVTLSPENSLENMKALCGALGQKAEVIVYQDTPLFISENCPGAAVSGCPGKGKCNFRGMSLTSKKLGNFTAISRNCRTAVISAKPLDLRKRAGEISGFGGAGIRLDFINRAYSPLEMAGIFRSVQK